MDLLIIYVPVAVAGVGFVLLVRRLAKIPPGRRRNRLLGVALVGFMIGMPLLVYVVMLVKYLFFDNWH
jgi:4-amino-4-deoxy-L-arabinose transferase-like glycosyltransferase